MSQGSDGFRTIKALVLDYVHACGGNVDYGQLTQQVKSGFPGSKWQKTHWAWYRYQIMNGRFKNQFSEEERSALAKTGGQPATPAVPVAADTTVEVMKPMRQIDGETKRVGDAILNHVRLVVSLAAGDDMAKRFKLNRWVFSRLLGDEIRVKRPIKKKLWENGMRICQACKQEFGSLKGVEIHRKDSSVGYSVENCELLCRDCHQELG